MYTQPGKLTQYTYIERFNRTTINYTYF